MTVVSHSDLCALAARWLKRPLAAGGHGCQIAFTETRTGYLAGESPDAIGFRVSTRDYGGGSTVVECKVSRADFLKDRDKPHRAAGCGMGRFRYHLCPEGLISPDEILPGWGLVVTSRKHATRVVKGAALSIGAPGPYDCACDEFAETMLLANLLHRVGNAERLNVRLRQADRANALLRRRLEKEEEAHRSMCSRYYALQYAAAHEGGGHACQNAL